MSKQAQDEKITRLKFELETHKATCNNSFINENDLDNILTDQVWLQPSSPEFEEKFIRHRSPLVVKLALVHQQISQLEAAPSEPDVVINPFEGGKSNIIIIYDEYYLN